MANADTKEGVICGMFDVDCFRQDVYSVSRDHRTNGYSLSEEEPSEGHMKFRAFRRIRSRDLGCSCYTLAAKRSSRRPSKG